MLKDESLVVFVWTVYGIMTALYLKIGNKYGFFIIEGLISYYDAYCRKNNDSLLITKVIILGTSIKQQTYNHSLITSIN